MSWWFSDIYCDLDQLKPILSFYDKGMHSVNYRDELDASFANDAELEFIKSLPIDLSEIYDEDIPKEHKGDVYQWLVYSIKKCLFNAELLEVKRSSTRHVMNVTEGGYQVIQSDTPIETFFDLKVHKLTGLRGTAINAVFYFLNDFIRTINIVNSDANSRTDANGREKGLPFSGITLVEAAIMLMQVFDLGNRQVESRISSYSEILDYSGQLLLDVDMEEVEQASVSIESDKDLGRHINPVFDTLVMMFQTRIQFRSYLRNAGLDNLSHQELCGIYAMHYTDFLWQELIKIGQEKYESAYNLMVNYYARSTLQFFLYSPYFKYGKAHQDFFGLIQTFDVNEDMPFDKDKYLRG